MPQKGSAGSDRALEAVEEVVGVLHGRRRLGWKAPAQ